MQGSGGERAVQRGWEWRAVCACEAGRAAHRGVKGGCKDHVTRRAVKQFMSMYFVVRTNMCIDMCCRNITVVLVCTVGD